jgi:hypothetical protein
MELNLLSSILRELILEHDRVSLPGMGSFIAEMAPSVFSDRAMVIHPPFRRILFRTSEVWNDGLLESRYAAERGIKEQEASAEIAEFVKKLKAELNVAKSYKLPDFGSMRATEQNDYFFVAEKGLFNYLEGFGLEPINIKVLNKKGTLETLTGKPEPFNYPKDSDIISDEAKPIKKEIPDVQESVEIKAENTERVVNAENVVSTENDIAVVIDESREESPAQLTTELADEDVKVEMPPVTPQENDKIEDDLKEVTAPNNSKFVRKFIIIISAVFFVIVIIALLFIFKDELRPFWEWLLYTQEERDILKSIK